MEKHQLTAEFRAEAMRLGFTAVGFCAAVPSPGFTELREWIHQGFAGQMRYLSDRLETYRHPDSILDGVRSIAMLAMNYSAPDQHISSLGHGKVSRYACGQRDYHDVIHERLKRLIACLHRLAPGSRGRGVVDTAPLLERQFARLSGLGWLGKHTLLLSRSAGSWFFLAAVLTDQDFATDAPFDMDHCGSCRACLDACPTNAFPRPYVLDATRCISYLTIELRDAIPRPLRNGVGDWLFGCDVCQDVCPWNQKAPVTSEPEFQPTDELKSIELSQLFCLDDDGFRHRFRHTPLWRARRRGLLRNAAIVLGNQKATAARPALVSGLNDLEPLVRGASAWALGQIQDDTSRKALKQRLEVETDHQVIEEIHAALDPGQPNEG